MTFASGASQIVRDFSGWTSAHGVPHAGSARSVFLRAFWSVVFVGCLVTFSVAMFLLVRRYRHFDVTVQTEA